ncbi:hypothetical protein AB0C96_14995 [Streptomyces sp. NPDC048506]|uniref:hypothetical protein n=1 Tax=Streptomyces sp. NPDC048506 TaxID=3155028 RepID=UPI00341C4ACC
MNTVRLRHRLAGVAALSALVGAGALATAPSAAAKANVLTLTKVSLHAPGLRANVTYSCDPGMNHELVANATALDRPGHDESIAAGTVKKAQLVCDYKDHTTQVTLRPAAGSHFAKGDKVKVAVFYFDEDGFSYARQEAVAVL